MAIITNSIGSGIGRDFSTLQAWADSIPADVVASGNRYIGECYNDSEFGGSANLLSLTGHTVDSTHYITLKCATGQSFRDNPTVQANALRYNAANGVAITSTTEAGATIFCDDDFTVFDGLQIQNTATFGAKALHLGAAPESITLSNLIIDARLTTGIVHDLSAGGDRTNVLIIDRSGSGNPSLQTSKAANFYFCRIVSPSDLTDPSAAIDGGSVALQKVFENCDFWGCALVEQNSPTPGSYTTCMTDIASPPSGVTGSKTYANQFYNTTNSAGDWRTKAGADLIDAGTSDPTHGAFDIAKTTRPQGAAYDIGPWEVVMAATGGVFLPPFIESWV